MFLTKKEKGNQLKSIVIKRRKCLWLVYNYCSNDRTFSLREKGREKEKVVDRLGQKTDMWNPWLISPLSSFFLSSPFLLFLQNIRSSSRSLEHQKFFPSEPRKFYLSDVSDRRVKKLSSWKQGSYKRGEEEKAEERRVSGSSRTSGWYNSFSVVEKSA